MDLGEPQEIIEIPEPMAVPDSPEMIPEPQREDVPV